METQASIQAYRIARKFGRELNLAVWRSAIATAKVNLPIFLTPIYTYGDPLPNHQI